MQPATTKWLAIGAGTALVVAFLFVLSHRNHQPRIAALGGVPGDDASVLLTRCGSADLQTSTAFEKPVPEVPNLWLVYNKHKIKALFVPGGDARPGDKPPYQWKLLGFTEAADAHVVLEKNEALHRLSCARVLLPD